LSRPPGGSGASSGDGEETRTSMKAPRAQKLSVLDVKGRHEVELLQLPGVQGVGIGDEAGRPVINVYVDKKVKALQESIPPEFDGYPVRIEVTGPFRALKD